MVNTPIDR